MDYTLLYWPVAVGLFAFLQGRLMPAIRRTPLGEEAQEQAFALHWIGTLFYFLPVCLEPTWPHVVAAFMSRVLLFDPVLNTAARRPPFEVGRTALWDRLLRKLSPAKPERLSVAVRVVALAGAVLAALLLSSCRSSDITRTQPGQAVSDLPSLPIPADGGVNTGKLPEGLTDINVAQSVPAESEALRVAQLPNKVQRRYRRNVRAAKASAPLVQGRGAVAAANISAPVQTSYKPAGPQAQATDSATIQQATAAKNAQAASGKGNVLEKVEPVKPSFWQQVTSLFTGLTSTVGWVALAVVLLHAFGPGIGYGVGWARRLVA